jgi:hypothetical protein
MISWVMIEIIATYHPSTVAANAINAMIDTENIIFLLVYDACVYMCMMHVCMMHMKKWFKILWGSVPTL